MTLAGGFHKFVAPVSCLCPLAMAGPSGRAIWPAPSKSASASSAKRNHNWLILFGLQFDCARGLTIGLTIERRLLWIFMDEGGRRGL
jgi:hypothetical protein